MKNKYVSSLVAIIKIAKQYRTANLESFVNKIKNRVVKAFNIKNPYSISQLEDTLGLRLKLTPFSNKKIKSNVNIISNIQKFLKQKNIQNIPKIGKDNIFFYFSNVFQENLESYTKLEKLEPDNVLISKCLEVLSLISNNNDFEFVNTTQFLDFDVRFTETGIHMEVEPESISELYYDIAVDVLKSKISELDSLNSQILWDSELINKSGPIKIIPNFYKIRLFGSFIESICFSVVQDIIIKTQSNINWNNINLLLMEINHIIK